MISGEKIALRKKYIDLRNAISNDNLELKSLEIANRTLELPIWEKEYFHLFLSIQEKKEIQTDFLLHILHGKDKSVVISKSDFKTHEMNHFLLQENTKLKISNYGIPEPVSGIPIAPEIIDVVFVPLLAFDKNGHRVGYGKGFYDRFLSRCKSDAVFVGLSLFEPEEQIVHGENDIPLDFCVTSEKIYSF